MYMHSCVHVFVCLLCEHTCMCVHVLKLCVIPRCVSDPPQYNVVSGDPGSGGEYRVQVTTVCTCALCVCVHAVPVSWSSNHTP